jgi:hypothetical protein
VVVPEELLLVLLPPPQPTPVNKQPKTTRESSDAQRRLRGDVPTRQKPATKLAPVVKNQISPRRERAAVALPGITLAAVVVTVKVEVALAVVLLRVTEVGLREHPTVTFADAQVSDTVPVKPPSWVTVTVDVPVAPLELTVAATVARE